MRNLTLTLAALLAFACAPAAECDCAADADSAGGEDDGPLITRSTTPLPVPAPAVPREQLSEALQSVWTHVEEAVAVHPPNAPEDSSSEAVQAWADGPFRAWVDQRTQMARDMRGLAQEMSDEHEHSEAERAVAAALFGYMYEDFVAGAHGAPIPENIASDAELLRVYAAALDESLMPYVERSFDAFMFCASHVAQSQLLVETPWASWGLYCYQRAGEIDEVYNVTIRRHMHEGDHADPRHAPEEGEPAGATEEGAADGEEATEETPAEDGEAEPVSALEPSDAARRAAFVAAVSAPRDA